MKTPFQLAFGLFALLWSVITLADCPRIISQSPYITHQLEYLGLKNCIVGTSRYDAKLNLAQTGGVMDPDASAIAALKPDLWITSTWTKPDVFEKSMPPNAKALRLDSFNSMAQISDNLIDIAQATQDSAALAQAEAFATRWHDKLAQVDGKQKRILLLSSCGKQPYAYGQQTWLGDLFKQANFQVIDFEKRIINLGQDKNEQQTLALIQSLQPDLIAVFHQTTAETCGLLDLPKITQLVVLNGDHFLHPSPTLLNGIDQLIAIQSIWQQN
jgi:iron complex transport system substrate-binding protein